MATFDEFYASLPAESGMRGEFFEKIFVPWFLKTDPVWSSTIKSLWLWADYPYWWGIDCGIDLVYEDISGKHWAVQCKCVSPDREISKAEIDSFLSESNDPRIFGRLLIASTDGIGKNALQVINRQEKQVICFLREHFRNSAVDFPKAPHNLASGRRKKLFSPKAHQQEAIRNVVEGLKINDRGQLLMACGTGKTLTSLWIKEELRAQRTLVLLPSLSLLSQTLREWTANSQAPFNWICVCSDQSVARQYKTGDEWTDHVSEIGVPVTSNPIEIKQFLLANKEGVVFSTYQSSPLVAEAQQNLDIPFFDIAFADEAHRCAGKVSSAFGGILNNQIIRARKRVFMTATPRFLSTRVKASVINDDSEYASMDDDDIFGPVLHRLSFSEAIDRELLTDYRVIVICVDNPEIKELIDNRELASIGDGQIIDYELLAHHIALSKVVVEYALQRVITFHARIKSARQFAFDHLKILDCLPSNLKPSKRVIVDHVSGEMSALERHRRINTLRDVGNEEVCILSNARCLTEGVDVPALDGIAFIDPRSSQVDIIQAVGRAIRLSDNKSKGYILLPVFLGDIDNIDDALLRSRFQDVWQVIAALKTQDDMLADVLDRLRMDLGQRPNTMITNQDLEKIIFYPQQLSEKLGASLRAIIVKLAGDGWMEKYGLLKSYLDRYGHASPDINEPVLGNWVSLQRRIRKLGKLTSQGDFLYNGNRLSKAQFVLLEQLDGWVWSVRDKLWADTYNSLKEFSRINKHSSPHASTPLGVWVKKQRIIYNNGSLNENGDFFCDGLVLSQNEVYLLESLEAWTWNPLDQRWEERFAEVLRFISSNNRLPRFPRNTATDALMHERKLASWCSFQKTKQKNNSISIDQLQRLVEVGIISQVADSSINQSKHGDRRRNRGDRVWKEKYELLKYFAIENGHSSPSQQTSLGVWVKNQRVVFTNGTDDGNGGKEFQRRSLSKDQIMLLESLSGWTWDALAQRWDEIFKDFSSFTSIHHRMPRKYKTITTDLERQENILYNWCYNQKKRLGNGLVPGHQISRLKSNDILRSWLSGED